MVNSDQFGKRLQRIMDEYDLNATSFADEIEVGRSSISHILSGRNKPSLEFVMKIVSAFPEVELYWLLNGKGSFPKKTGGLSAAPKLSSNQLQADFESISPSNSESSQQNSQMPHTDPVTETLASVKEEAIERIVIFYKDGTFKNFVP
ncbi:helix-turn-helix domain-containing protein [Leeuwenhoekiella sp. MAR_2009_132]|uniref:helix-turn-helix domain-containing protein n=1 Tax=Leeuwenhoekiella sp. MAR_2009_132 TaxID=1392489 RepID=UPI00048BB096|nr:helix-turn-helix transcriptional regulator [Leeuwenhoekiella sp. MAR_2009_132]